MSTLAELRATLTARGYSIHSSANPAIPTVSVHTHPLLSSPVVLIGADGDTAKDYQSSIVQEAIKRR